MIVKRVTDSAEFFETLLHDPNAFGLHTIGCVDWPAEFPARPDVLFAIAHTGGEMLLKFFVNEEYTLARVTEDNGEVWTDSCVEFFISFDQTGYYNLECTCIGKALLGFRKERENFVHATPAVMHTIRRNPSLGIEPFAERRNQQWTLEVSVPATAFFKHDIGDLSGVTARANFYKCGDNLTVPHFLSWQPIDNPTPDFHIELFFGDIKFEL
jgi:hypothetical protein